MPIMSVKIDNDKSANVISKGKNLDFNFYSVVAEKRNQNAKLNKQSNFHLIFHNQPKREFVSEGNYILFRSL